MLIHFSRQSGQKKPLVIDPDQKKNPNNTTQATAVSGRPEEDEDPFTNDGTTLAGSGPHLVHTIWINEISSITFVVHLSNLLLRVGTTASGEVYTQIEKNNEWET